MIAFKKGNFLDEEKMTKEEAYEFVIFLREELIRHENHLNKWKETAESELVSDFLRVVAQTVVVRDLDDIAHTNRTINYLVEKYNLE